VAASVDLVVHVGTDGDGRRRVREIVALPGRAEGGVIETADVFASREGRLVRADGFPPHPERFAAAGFDLAGLLR
jgi:pilus assembly protein CpaF